MTYCLRIQRKKIGSGYSCREYYPEPKEMRGMVLMAFYGEHTEMFRCFDCWQWVDVKFETMKCQCGTEYIRLQFNWITMRIGDLPVN